MTQSIKPACYQCIISRLAIGLGAALLLSGCGTSQPPYKPIPAPQAAVVTNADIDNLLRIVVELRKDIAALKQQVRKLQAQR